MFCLKYSAKTFTRSANLLSRGFLTSMGNEWNIASTALTVSDLACLLICREKMNREDLLLPLETTLCFLLLLVVV